MRCAILVLAALALPRLASAQSEPASSSEAGDVTKYQAPFEYPHAVRMLVGLGYVPSLPSDDRSSKYLPDNMVMTAEIGGHPLSGALGTGFSVSTAMDVRGLWSVLTPGLFAKLNLTYLFLTGLWTYGPPPPAFPFRLKVGGRLGVGISQSTRPSGDVPNAATYVLIRPELLDFVDIEWPLGSDRAYSFVARGALDTPVNLSSVFRWSVSAGLSYGWGQ